MKFSQFLQGLVPAAMLLVIPAVDLLAGVLYCCICLEPSTLNSHLASALDPSALPLALPHSHTEPLPCSCLASSSVPSAMSPALSLFWTPVPRSCLPYPAHWILWLLTSGLALNMGLLVP